jgi:hypothetical protein
MMLKLRGRLRLTALIVVLVFIVSLLGCASQQTTIAFRPPEKYEKLGHATGSATGSLGILATAYYFVPMGLNERVGIAYERALQSVPGATSLINVTYEESWYWWVLGTARTVTISGDAIKEVIK